MSLSVEGDNGAVSESLRDQLMLLIATPVGTVVFDRDFGIEHSMVDMPLNDLVCTELAAELSEKIEKYIPRLRLREVLLESGDLTGEMHIRVVVDYDRESF